MEKVLVTGSEGFIGGYSKRASTQMDIKLLV